VIVSGTAPIWPDGSVEPDEYLQTMRCFQIIEGALNELGARLDQVVRTRMFLTDAAWAGGVSRAHGEVMAGIQPAATMVVVKQLLDERWRVEIEAEAVIP
jgi:enamine deaminase RidA (YjgF/YER057c/UK114 family)